VTHLKNFAATHEVILFVAGDKSSNGKILFNHCKEINDNTYLISNESQLKREWFDSVSSIGICGATSTPRWLMEKVKSSVTELV
jgi:4-hydroxy-3-methylbut-2-enyl diphosphate reductase